MLLLLTRALAQECDPTGVFPEWSIPPEGDVDVALDQTFTVGFRGVGDLAEWDVRVEVDGIEVPAAVASACWVEAADPPVACIFVVDPTEPLPAGVEVVVIAAEAGVDTWEGAVVTGTTLAPAPGQAPSLALLATGAEEDACMGVVSTMDVSVGLGDAAYVILRAGLDVHGTAIGVARAGGDAHLLLPPGAMQCVAADPVAVTGVHGTPVAVCPPGVIGSEGCDTGILCVIGNCCGGAGGGSAVLLVGLLGGWSRLRRRVVAGLGRAAPAR